MDMLAIVQKVWRHKLAALPVIILTVVGLAYVTVLKPKVYQAQASYILINPPAPPSTQQIQQDPALAKLHTDNPYVRFSDLSIVVQLLTQAMSTVDTQQQLAAQGVAPGWTVGPSTQIGFSPIFQVTASAPSPAEATKSARLVSNATTGLLNTLQARDQVSPGYQITALQLQSPNQATLQVSSLLRTVVAVLAVGIIMLFIAVSTASGLEEHRALRRSGEQHSGESPRDPSSHARPSDADPIVTDRLVVAPEATPGARAAAAADSLVGPANGEPGNGAGAANGRMPLSPDAEPANGEEPPADRGPSLGRMFARRPEEVRNSQ
jgi:hypothetical protein